VCYLHTNNNSCYSSHLLSKMISHNNYNQIYLAEDDSFLSILFYNSHNNNALIFDGLYGCYSQTELLKIPNGYHLLKYDSPTVYYQVEAIKQEDDVFFIKLLNEDLFFVHTMPVGYTSLKQVLHIYSKEKHSKISTPSGVSIYDSILLRYSQAEFCESK
jgi:hypothetical protein